MVKQLLLFDKQKLEGHISLRKGKDVSLRVSRLYIVRNCMNWNFISVPSVIRCTLRFFLFFLFRGDSSSPRYVKKNSQELSFIIKLRHRFSLIRKLIKSLCNYACCPISQHFKQTDLTFFFRRTVHTFTLVSASVQRPPLYNGHFFLSGQVCRCREVQLYNMDLNSDL